MENTLLLTVILVPGLIIAIVFHEVAHGWTALMLGDSTAKDQRRLSLNPIRHVDPIGTLLVPGFLLLVGGPVFGWAKPVPVLKNRLDNPRWGMVLVAAAGPGTNLILGGVGAVLLGLHATTLSPGEMLEPGLVTQGLFTFILINVFLAFFNLLPIPPFDGSHILEGVLPRKWARAYEKLRPAGMVLFFVLVALTWVFPDSGIIANTVLPPVNWAMGQYLEIAQNVAGG